MNPKKNVYTTYQVAKLCNVHHTTVINWINLKKLPGYTTPGGHRRIEKADLVKFMEENEIPIPVELKKREKRILIVDDDPEALDELSQALNDDKYEISLAADGFEAGMKIFRRLPDIILLDFKMPGMNGFEVCETLSMEEETAGIPIIAITALRSDEDVKRIKKCGVKKYMSKPLDLDILKEWIIELVGEKKAANK